MSIKVYVEGGARGCWAQCREGFAAFFSKAVGPGKISVKPSGSRDAAYRDFCIALRQYPSDLVLLLVDSEDEVVDPSCWTHLHRRDKWDRPSDVGADHAHLMVRCMESWFLADKQALSDFYGQGFIVNALPKSSNVESVSRKDVAERLARASKPTSKGAYHKTRHGFDILAAIDPSKVAESSPHAKRLIDFLVTL